MTCRKLYAPAKVQLMAELPKERFTLNEPPFSHEGTDLFGPLLTKTNRSRTKQYGVIFICLAVRAIHIKIAYSLDTSSFIQALRCFVARRVPVVEIKSDNGTNLVGSKRELREAIQNWNGKQIHHFLLQKGIDWSFNPPGASHHGRIWERQITSVRKQLNAICQEQLNR